MESQNLPWFFESEEDVVRSGRYQLKDGNVRQYSQSYAYDKFPALLFFSTDSRAEIWKDKFGNTHRVGKPAVINDFFQKTVCLVEYFYYGLKHYPNLDLGPKEVSFFYGAKHGGYLTSRYYGYNLRIGKLEAPIANLRDLTIALSRKEEKEDLELRLKSFQDYEEEIEEYNIIPLYKDYTDAILWLRAARPDINFTSDKAVSEMIKETALKILYGFDDELLKVLKRYGKHVARWYRSARELKIENQSFTTFMKNNVSPSFEEEVISWLKEEGLGKPFLK